MKTAAAALIIGWGLMAAPAVAQAQAAEDPNAPPAWMTEPRDWSATLRDDATALHAVIVDSHPGIHDSLNPQFRAKVDAGLAEALARAETASDAGGWWWAMRAYVAAFDDGHVQIGLTNGGRGFTSRWPGFLTSYRGGEHRVADRDQSDASAPPMGARLIDCGGVDADTLAERRIGAFRGRWFLEAQRETFGDWLFLNASNPWIDEPASCRFEVEGAPRAYSLNWRPIGYEEVSERRTRVMRRAAPDFAFTRLDDGGFWLSLPSFNGDPGSEPHAALTAMLAETESRQTELRTAPYVVLDLRGNGGGSSHWGEALALSLWGRDWMWQHHLPPIEAIEWRASEANLAAVQKYLDDWTASGEEEMRINWARQIVEGMTRARAEGQPYWRDRSEPEGDDRPPTPPASLLAGPVYVLTDPACGSACLDAVDTWKAAGAIQIGRETSADTVYMDVRDQSLPSGLAAMAIPMKVWRGRARGNNEPQLPTYIFDGDMSDDAALRAWVATLGAR